MRLFLLGLLMLGSSLYSVAQIKTEKDLIHEIVVALQTHDDSTYASLQPTYDKMWKQVIQYNDTSSYKMRRLANIRSNPRKIQQYDPEYNPYIVKLFDVLIGKAIDSGLHWNDILIARYELKKQRLAREMIGLELIAPIRMNGYIFVQDVLTRKMFCIVLVDIFLIEGAWYGGRVINILEASTIQEYDAKRPSEQKAMQAIYLAMQNGTIDSIIAARDSVRNSLVAFGGDDDEDDKPKDIYKEVVERKVYIGKLDNEIDIEIYIRGLKGKCPQEICQWEAIYKFGDLDEFLILSVERKQDGTFVLTEEDVGVMELQLTKGGKLFGSWTSFKDGTGYEAVLFEEKAIRGRVLKKYDKIITDYAIWND